MILPEILEKMPNVNFYWAGDGIYKEKILEKVKEFKNFHWIGNLNYPNEVQEFLSEIDAYALITGIDMSPLTLLEAQLMEKPVIATEVGGIPELMIDGKTGFLIEKNNPKDLEEKILFILKEISTQKMGSEGKKFVIEHFNWEIIAKKFKSILEQYLKNSKN